LALASTTYFACPLSLPHNTGMNSRFLPVAIGLRYVRSRDAGFFVSFSSWLSLTGVCVGVAALIVILSVMNGFEGELRGRLLAMGAPVTLTTATGRAPLSLTEWESIDQRLRASGLPVRGTAPFLEQQGLLANGAEMTGALVRGIDPVREATVSAAARSMIEGRLDSLQPGLDRIILGNALADQLGVPMGGTVTVLVPGGNRRSSAAPDSRSDLDFTPQLRTFTVVGFFEAGVADHDAGLALIHLVDAWGLSGGEGDLRPAGLRVDLPDPMGVTALRPALSRAAGSGLRVRDWTDDNAAYFHAIRVEKLMVTAILLLVVGIAAFNIVAMLVMVVRAKRTDIAILRTLGLSPRDVLRVFIVQGLFIGWVGAASGICLGLALACNVETLVPWLERAFGFQVFDAAVYYETAIPSDPRWVDVMAIAVAAFTLTWLATLYPARRAAATPPAVALRYE
jgi:lipoprotein-releasing system permease protein